jgi:hypothetical protein
VILDLSARMKEWISLVTGEVNDESNPKTLPWRLEEALVESEPKDMLVCLIFG